MDTSTSRFPYIIDNLIPTGINLIDIILGIIIMLALAFLLGNAFLYGRGYAIMLQEKKNIEKKKNVLSELILMKDIQTELESEIEKAMLKSTFQ